MSKLIVGVAASVVCASLFTARVASAEGPPEEPKDRGTAFALSAGGTLASIGLTAVGVGTGNGELMTIGAVSSLITPAAGQIYAGKVLTWGMAIRGASAVVLVAGLEEAYKCLGAGLFGTSSDCHHDPREAGQLLLAGGIGYAAGVLYDIATAGRAVDDYNKKLHVQVTPLVGRSSAKGQTIGLGLSGQF